MMEELKPKPLFDAELILESVEKVTVITKNNTSTVHVTPQTKDASKKLLMLGIQLSILSSKDLETPEDRKFAAAMSPILTAIVTGILPEVSEVLRGISNPSFDNYTFVKSCEAVHGKISNLLEDARLAAKYNHENP